MREYAGMAETNIEELQERVAELEAALRFYADKDDYVYSLSSNVWDDKGEVARKALGEVK